MVQDSFDGVYLLARTAGKGPSAESLFLRQSQSVTTALEALTINVTLQISKPLFSWDHNLLLGHTKLIFVVSYADLALILFWRAPILQQEGQGCRSPLLSRGRESLDTLI